MKKKVLGVCVVSLACALAMGTGRAETRLSWTSADGKPVTYGTAPKTLPTGCEPFVVERPRERDGAVVDAADFGVSESIDDNNAALQRAVDHCRKVGAKKLVMKKGTYRFFGPRSVTFDSLTDFTFDAQGATLVFRRESAWRPAELIWQATFHPEDANFSIRNCERCLFRNYAMDWDWEHDPLATFARVIAVHPDDKDDPNSSVDFELVDYVRHPFYPKPMPFQCNALMKESREGFAPVDYSYDGVQYLGLCEGGYGKAMEWLSPNRIRFYPAKEPTAPGTHTRESDSAKFENKVVSPRKGRTTAQRYKVGRLYRLAHYYPGKSGVYMDGNRHLTLENANIYSCRGMAHVIDGPQHHTHFLHVHVAPPAGVKRPVTATADACHVACSRGYLKLEDFRVTLNQDDFSNIHDRTSSGRRADVRTIEIVHPRGNLYFGMRAGNEIEVRNPDFSPFGFRAKVVAVDGERLTVDRDIPETMKDGSILYNCAFATDHVWWKDCVIEESWGRGGMMCNDLTFENCTFREDTASPIKIQAAFHAARWAEGTGVTNQVYRGCTFEDNQVYNRAAFGTVISEIFIGVNFRQADYSADLNRKPWIGTVSDILFENCRFVRPRGAIAHLQSGRNVSFVNNELVPGHKADRQNLPYAGTIIVDDAEGLYVTGNIVREAALWGTER